MPSSQTSLSRRHMLQFLLSSPLLGSSARPLMAQIAEDRDYLPDSAMAAVNVFDMENLARAQLSKAHWTYISQGVDDELTLRANRQAWQEIRLKARRLVDVRTIDTRSRLFGETLHSPLLVAPVGGLGMAHREGDIAVARGARARGHKMLVSTAATFRIEDTSEALGEPAWFQLYPSDDWQVTQGLLRRVEANGTGALFLTVDIPARNQDRMRRFSLQSAECQACHQPDSSFADKAMMAGLPLSASADITHAGMDWDYVRRLRDSTSMKLVIKGLNLAEDAEQAVAAGVDGIVVSNHGGRADDFGVATAHALPDVVAAVQGRVPVLVDGGIRRGTDILKALALGADAVMVGRPYIWGLGAFGSEGVARVLEILDLEFQVAMRQAGVTQLTEIDQKLLHSSA